MEQNEKRKPENGKREIGKRPIQNPVAALCERRWASDSLKNHGGHRPLLQLKTPFAVVSKRVVFA
jgi:hypothetical protein